MSRLIPVREAAKTLGVSVKTLHRWHASGQLVPATRLPSGARRYTPDQLASVTFGEPSEAQLPRERAVTYARVSSAKQARDGNLDRQDQRLRAVVAANGWELLFAVKETASGVNENRKGLARVLTAARKGRFDVLVVEFPDRLARFGFKYLQAAFEASDVRIHVVDAPAQKKEPTAELVDDLLSIVMVFAARMYGRRAAQVRASVKTVLVDAESEAA